MARIAASAAAIASTAQTKPSVASSAGAEQESDPLHRVLRAGEQGDPAEESARLRRGEQLHRRFRRHLGEVLGDPARALDDHHVGDRDRDRPAGIEPGQRDEGRDLQAEPGIERRGQPEPRRDPAGGQVGDHAGDLVEHEEIGELHRREAQRVEVQQDQHPERAVGEHEGPVGRGDGDVGGEPLGSVGGCCHSDAPTISATSTSRCA